MLVYDAPISDYSWHRDMQVRPGVPANFEGADPAWRRTLARGVRLGDVKENPFMPRFVVNDDADTDEDEDEDVDEDNDDCDDDARNGAAAEEKQAAGERRTGSIPALKRFVLSSH